MKKNLILLVVLLLSFAPDIHAGARQLKIGISTGYPPFYFFTADNRPTGICIDILNQIAEHMEISVAYTSYPWQRMLLYGKDGTADAVMPLFKTSEREQFLVFPETALVHEDNSFFTAASSKTSYSGTLTDVAGNKIAVIDGYSYGREFDQTEFRNKVIVKDTEQLIKLVLSGRVDFGIGNSKVIAFTAHKINSASSIRFLSPAVTVEALHIGFSKITVDPDFVERFSRHLQQFKTTEAYRQIIESYNGM